MTNDTSIDNDMITREDVRRFVGATALESSFDAVEFDEFVELCQRAGPSADWNALLPFAYREKTRTELARFDFDDESAAHDTAELVWSVMRTVRARGFDVEIFREQDDHVVYVVEG